MTYYYVILDLFDLNDFSIYLQLTRNRLFKIDNFYILNEWDNDGSDRTLKIYVSEDDKSLAERKLKGFIDLINFLSNIDLTITSTLNIHITKELPKDTAEANNKNVNRIVRANRYINEIDIKEEHNIVPQLIRYYSRSLKLIDLELYEEAYLTVFKPLELLSNFIYKKYFKENTDRYINNVLSNLLQEYFNEEFKNEDIDKEINDTVLTTLPKIITQRRKITKLLEFLKLEEHKEKIGDIVSLRNKAGAHSHSGAEKINIDTYTLCQTMCKEIISRYLFHDDSLEIATLDVYKQW